VSDVPELPRGKGNKLFGISAKKAATREEFLTGLAVVTSEQKLVVVSGERRMTLNRGELDDYRGQRAQRGGLLPRGWRKVDRLEIEG
jgi:topoisomerase-4 subunit A